MVSGTLAPREVCLEKMMKDRSPITISAESIPMSFSKVQTIIQSLNLVRSPNIKRNGTDHQQ